MSWLHNLILRTILSLVLGVLILGELVAEESAEKLDLTLGWKFSMADDARSHVPEFDDSLWKTIKVSKTWEELGYPNHDGYAWYRLRTRIAPTLLTSSENNSFGLLRLNLGKIDDVDQTWLHGQLIGETGLSEPTYASQWDKQRTYCLAI